MSEMDSELLSASRVVGELARVNMVGSRFSFEELADLLSSVYEVSIGVAKKSISKAQELGIVRSVDGYMQVCLADDND